MNSIYKLFFFIGVFVVLLTSSCEIINPAEPIPAYLSIKNFTLTTDYATQGTNSNKISDAWVYVDDKLIGCFELPATLPVIAAGVHTLKVKAGIKVNGISNNRAPYPFYTTYQQSIDFQPGKTIDLTPVVEYFSNTNFEFLEDFEGTGSTIAATAGSDTTFQKINSPNPNVFEGSASGTGYTDASKPIFECATINKFILPKGGSPIFLEFNYRCNAEFTVSINAYGFNSTERYEALTFFPSYSWNKAYIYLTPTVSGASSAIEYQIVWGLKNFGNTELLLDNIKLIY